MVVVGGLHEARGFIIIVPSLICAGTAYCTVSKTKSPDFFQVEETIQHHLNDLFDLQ